MNYLKSNPVTTLIIVLTVIVALAGALVTIVNPSNLSFNDYLDGLSKFVIGLGLLGIGRGVKAAANGDGAADNVLPLELEGRETHSSAVARATDEGDGEQA